VENAFPKNGRRGKRKFCQGGGGRKKTFDTFSKRVEKHRPIKKKRKKGGVVKGGGKGGPTVVFKKRGGKRLFVLSKEREKKGKWKPGDEKR